MGLDYANQQLSLSNDLGSQYGLIGAYENLGILELRKGAYDLAFDYFTRGIDLANELNLRFTKANLEGHIANLHTWLSNDKFNARVHCLPWLPLWPLTKVANKTRNLGAACVHFN